MRVVGTEDAEIGFEFLIGSFGLSIGLRVVGGGEFDIIFQETGKFSWSFPKSFILNKTLDLLVSPPFYFSK